MAIKDESTTTLLTVRANLLRGLDQVAAHLDAGTFHDIGGKSSSPAQSGQLTLVLLKLVNTELAHRQL